MTTLSGTPLGSASSSRCSRWLLVRQTVAYFSPTLTFPAAIWKESLIWVSAIVLLILVRRGERLPFTSVGLGTSTWWKSVLWGFVIAVVCAIESDLPGVPRRSN